MGQSCLQKSQSLLLSMMETAHSSSQKLLSYYSKKEGYQNKTNGNNDFDYEREILLEEDDDDFQAFDYEEQNELIVIAHKAKINSQSQYKITPPQYREQNSNQHRNQVEKQDGIKKSPGQHQQVDLLNLNQKEQFGVISLEKHQNDHESLDYLVNEIENSLITNNFESTYDKSGLNLEGEEMNEEDQNAFLRELDNQIKYEDDDEDDDEVGILDRI
ncbi:UNKNOWN [Stylonychia lemnae]|uniref:Uncharacterized protein n=1 Tax=Stylonychia lemnae TaxID=5949 RepID=A0A078B5F5_STYLE|nr:UNKNOWN [Stylonychia lemnae]|eukprot:CDW89755.1 UNKNOWN [Stylonychia lemnae]